MMTLPRREWTRRWPDRAPACHVLATTAMIVLLVGCAGKTEAQLATDELNAGLAASAANQEDQAKAHYDACLKHDSRNQFCIYNLGVIAGRHDQVVEAENAYRLALLIDPNFPSPIFNLAILRAAAGSNDEAIGLYRHYIELRPNEAGGHLNLGLLLRATGQIAESDKELALALQLDPSIKLPSFAPVSPKPSALPAASAGPSAS